MGERSVILLPEEYRFRSQEDQEDSMYHPYLRKKGRVFEQCVPFKNSDEKHKLGKVLFQ